ncbi:hypothetical protein T01_4267 [Trichinella spiralis]|uniref:Uncharacterized protein n=1 Tax=Trichinella spiralis TaxID=6334 RepID=A0A0V1AX04_TRISP|nr:hypothetical protein T01_4267 [Trichinella spiralis]
MQIWMGLEFLSKGEQFDGQASSKNCSRQFHILKDSLIISLIVFEKENIARTHKIVGVWRNG